MTEIKNYAIRMHGGPSGDGTGVRAHIHLFDGNNRLVGRVNFFENGVTLPQDSYSMPQDGKQGIVQIGMSLNMLANVVDMLRNEGPVYCHWQAKIGNAYLGTSAEPVGEGE